MRTGRPKAELKLSAQEHAQLSSLAASRSLPHALMARARLVLWAAAGDNNRRIAQRLCWSMPTAGKWRRRFVEQRLAGLHDELRAGRPRSYGDEQVAQLINRVLHSKPTAATHWSVRSVAGQSGISKSTVARYFALFGLQPQRSKSFKRSTNPFFIEKVRDVVGLYRNPPDRALVLCVDEKRQVQAPERTQPVLPMGLGYVEGVTHDYFRHGTTARFAALNVLDGSVIAQCKPRHRHQEFLSFLNHLERSVPRGPEVHLIAGNYAAHKHPKVKAWLARSARYHLRYTPTYASWLNQVERWFALITQQAIRRGSFKSARELAHQIGQYLTHHNAHKRPFAWTATADSIFAKLQRLCKLINGTPHWPEAARFWITTMTASHYTRTANIQSDQASPQPSRSRLLCPQPRRQLSRDRNVLDAAVPCQCPASKKY
jgi:transposase